MKTNFLNKISYACAEFFQAFRTPSSPCLIMTLLVKNEEAMLERNLLFHKAMGVDYFIVTDNNSTDHTPEILEKYRQRGWIKAIIQETATNYEQKVWVDRMIWLAKTRFHADWVINADADELWYAPSGNLKEELSHTAANVLQCALYNVYPEENRPYWEWSQTVRPIEQPENYGLSMYSLFNRQKYKVIHRTAGYLQIAMGNHKVRMFPQYTRKSQVTIYHYCIRSKQAFLDKMVNGGQQLEKDKKLHRGRHWRYFYRLYQEGKLEEIYDHVIGRNVYESLYRDGYIVTDPTISELFKRQELNPPPSV